MSKQIEIHNMEYMIEWDRKFKAYRRESSYVVNGKSMVYIEMTSDKNAPAFTEHRLKILYEGALRDE